MEDTGPDDITKELTIRTLERDGRLECTAIHPITDEEAAAYRSLGSASANDLGTLLMLACRRACLFDAQAAVLSWCASTSNSSTWAT